MKVGIVSKKPHCKSHKSALEEMGFCAQLLGGDPGFIANSFDFLLVRVASVSHAGEKLARNWGKKHNKPVIYENGVSGLIRKLNDLGLYRSKKMTPLQLPQTTSPPDPRWGKAVSFEKLCESYEEVMSGLSSIDQKVVKKAKSLTEVEASQFDVKSYARTLEAYFKYKGKPLAAVVFFYVMSSEDFVPYLRDVRKFYSALTGRGVETNLIKGVAWYLNRGEPLLAPRGGSHKDPKGAEPHTKVFSAVSPTPSSGISQPEVTESMHVDDPSVLLLTDTDTQESLTARTESNTQAILEVLEEVERLTAKVKALEVGQAETLRQARQAVAEMREGLRGDIADAFDALASDHPTPEASGNPFTAIEQVKAMLKAAGFTGTLTLTIE